DRNANRRGPRGRGGRPGGGRGPGGRSAESHDACQGENRRGGRGGGRPSPGRGRRGRPRHTGPGPAGQEGGRAPPGAARPARPGENLQETLLALEKESLEALKKQDVKALERLCAAEFVAVLGDGTRLTRKEFLDMVPQYKLEEYSLSEVELVRLGRDAALLLYRDTSKSAFAGAAPEEETLRVSSVWVRRDGQWENTFYQETPVE